LYPAKSAETSLRAFQAAPNPTSTGSVSAAQATANTGLADTENCRTTPEVRSVSTMV
jgi:hypothetical protein